MLPTPAIPDWSSRNDFSGAVRPAAISPSASGVNSSESGSTPSRAKRAVEVGVVDQEGLAEAARVGEPELAAVVERGSGRAGGARRSSARPRTAAVPSEGSSFSSPSTRTRLPVIRRCMTRVRPPSSASSRYLPRRPRPSIVRPARPPPPARPAAPAATSARRAPPAARSAAPPAPARAGGRRSRPRAARASPSSITIAIRTSSRIAEQTRTQRRQSAMARGWALK